MNPWRARVLAREAELSVYGDRKTAGHARVGLRQLLPLARDDDLAALHAFCRTQIAGSDRFFQAPPLCDAQIAEDIIRFPTQVPTGNRSNDMVVAQYFPGRGGRAVVLLPHWNAMRRSYVPLAGWFARLGGASFFAISSSY